MRGTTVVHSPAASDPALGFAWAVALSLVAWPLLALLCLVALTASPATLLGIAAVALLVAAVAHGARGR